MMRKEKWNSHSQWDVDEGICTEMWRRMTRRAVVIIVGRAMCHWVIFCKSNLKWQNWRKIWIWQNQIVMRCDTNGSACIQIQSCQQGNSCWIVELAVNTNLVLDDRSKLVWWISTYIRRVSLSENSLKRCSFVEVNTQIWLDSRIKQIA